MAKYLLIKLVILHLLLIVECCCCPSISSLNTIMQFNRHLEFPLHRGRGEGRPDREGDCQDRNTDGRPRGFSQWVWLEQAGDLNGRGGLRCAQSCRCRMPGTERRTLSVCPTPSGIRRPQGDLLTVGGGVACRCVGLAHRQALRHSHHGYIPRSIPVKVCFPGGALASLFLLFDLLGMPCPLLPTPNLGNPEFSIFFLFFF